MAIPSEGAKDLLVSAGVGVLAASNGWSIHVGRMVSSPSTCIAIFDTSGPASHPSLLLDYPGLQIRIRGEKGQYVAARQKAKDVKDVLLGLPSQNINGDRWVSVTIVGDITFIGYDAEDRPEFTTNWRLILEPTTSLLTNRTPL